MTRMHSLRSWVLAIVVFCIVAAISGVYVHEKYFFNPITFKKNAFLYESWNTYKNPLSMEIFKDSSGEKIVTDAAQIRFVMNEIERASNKEVSLPENFSGSSYVIFFHTGKILIQQVQIYPKEKLVQFISSQGIKYVPLSPNLLTYVQHELGASE